MTFILTTNHQYFGTSSAPPAMPNPNRHCHEAITKLRIYLGLHFFLLVAELFLFNCVNIVELLSSNEIGLVSLLSGKSPHSAALRLDYLTRTESRSSMALEL